MADYCRFYQIGDLTLQVESDLPIEESTFDRRLDPFRVESPDNDITVIHHHFGLPELEQERGVELYRKTPWAIYRQNGGFLYLGILPDSFEQRLWTLVKANHDHSRIDIYHPDEKVYRSGGIHSLTLFPSDQILVARLLADRQSCYLHSAGAIVNGAGMLFVGHSGAGKSTITQMLMDSATVGEINAEILCDDRNIVRRRDDGWRVYGSWSHGDISRVSPASAPLKAICFIEQAPENLFLRLSDRKEIGKRLLACVIRTLTTADWWHKILDLIERLLHEDVPCYVMRFDKSGAIVEKIKSLPLSEGSIKTSCGESKPGRDASLKQRKE